MTSRTAIAGVALSVLVAVSSSTLTATASATTTVSVAAPGTPADGRSDARPGATPLVDPNVESKVRDDPDGSVSVLARFAGEHEAIHAARDLPTDVTDVDAVVPLVALAVDADGLAQLREAPGIMSISEDREHTLELATTVDTVQVPLAWSQGATGAGTRIAVLDTGVLASHPFLADRIVAEACFSGEPSDWWGSGHCPGADPHHATGAGAAAPCDDHLSSRTICWHGTHVTGILAGHDGPGSAPSGVAPDADIVAAQVFSRSIDGRVVARDSDLIEAMDWVVQQQDPAQPIVALNMSLSGDLSSGPCDDRAGDALLKVQIDALRARGITVVAASGNDYDKARIGSPACISSVIAVGATTDGGAVTGFSNSSAALDLLAPGDAVTSSRFTFSGTSMVPGYGAVSGTSMAAPHVAGAIALVAQARGALSPALMELALERSGLPVTDNANGRITPLVQVADALAVELPPVGRLEAVEPAGSDVRLTGWAFDPDTSDPVDVEVRVGGVPAFRGAADVDRPDVFDSIPVLGTWHGFDVALPALPRGPHTVCTAVLDSATSVRFPLGCRVVTIAVGPPAPRPAFPDVAPGGLFSEAVDWLASADITTGYADATFRPTSNVTRQAVVAMLHRIAGSPSVALATTPTFRDVGAGAPFRTAIEWAAANGIITGYGDGTFRPVGPVSREAFAAMLHRSVGAPVPTPPTYPTFVDVPPGHVFATSIEWLAMSGIADGNANRTFGTSDQLSRQALAAFLARQQLALT